MELLGFPGGSDDEESTCSAGDLGLIPGSGRSPGEGNGNPLQFFCLENSTDGGAWWSAAHGTAKSRTSLSDVHSLTQAGKRKDYLSLIKDIYENPELTYTWPVSTGKYAWHC